MKYKLIVTNDAGEETITGGPAEAVLIATLSKIGKPTNLPQMFKLQSVNQCYISETAKPLPLVAMVATGYMGIELVRNHVKSIQRISFQGSKYAGVYDALDKVVVELSKAVSGADEVKYGTKTVDAALPDFQNLKTEINDYKLINRLKGRLNGNNTTE